jgi:hypothetical protein
MGAALIAARLAARCPTLVPSHERGIGSPA